MKGYREIRRGGMHLLVLEGWEERIPEWGVLEGAEVLREGSKKITRALPDGEGRLIVKVYRTPPLLRRIRDVIRGSPAMREIRLCRAAADRGIPVGLPVAAGRGPAGESFLIAHAASGSEPLDTLILDGKARGERRRRLIRGYGALARRAHDGGLLQEDLDPNNAVCLPGGEEIILIDMERATLGDPIPHGGRVRSLARLLRYGQALSRTDQVRFLRGYLSGEDAREWIPSIREGWEEVLRRDRDRIRRVCIRPGRMIATVEAGDIRGFLRTRYGEREASIFSLDHLQPILEILREGPIPETPIPVETRQGTFQVGIIPLETRRAQHRWQELNAALKGGSPETLPVALLGLGRRGFVLTGRADTYRPPPR
jgi:hypothetical protein